MSFKRWDLILCFYSTSWSFPKFSYHSLRDIQLHLLPWYWHFCADAAGFYAALSSFTMSLWLVADNGSFAGHVKMNWMDYIHQDLWTRGLWPLLQHKMSKNEILSVVTCCLWYSWLKTSREWECFIWCDARKWGVEVKGILHVDQKKKKKDLRSNLRGKNQPSAREQLSHWIFVFCCEDFSKQLNV